MPAVARDWVPNQPLTTGRLAWLAARDELRRRATPWWLVLLRVSSGRRRTGTFYARDVSSETTSDRMTSYALPVDVVSERLNPTEVAQLRQSGVLPEWFFDAVEEERRARRRG